MVNCLSDHDAQMLELCVVNLNSTRSDYKTVTIRKVDFNIINEFKVNILNTDKEYNKNVNAEIFDNYFLTTAENISHKIMGSNKQILSCAQYSLSYLSQVFNLPFTNIFFPIKHPQGKLKKLFTPSLGKTHVDMMKFQ